MTEKLDDKLELNEIKQTRTGRTPRPVIPFRDSAIDKIRHLKDISYMNADL